MTASLPARDEWEQQAVKVLQRESVGSWLTPRLAAGIVRALWPLVVPFVDRVEQAEAKAAKLRAERDTGKHHCCRHCPDDPEFHTENPKDSHDTSCITCDRELASEAWRALAALREGVQADVSIAATMLEHLASERRAGPVREKVEQIVTRLRALLGDAAPTRPDPQAEPAECTCPYTDPSTWLSAASLGYGSGYEPGSMQEWNPDCPVHPGAAPTEDGTR